MDKEERDSCTMQYEVTDEGVVLNNDFSTIIIPTDTFRKMVAAFHKRHGQPRYWGVTR